MEYRVLSLWQPWTSLVVHGKKKIETRPKPTNWTVEKGTYLIHAAQKQVKELYTKEPFKTALEGITSVRNIDRMVVLRSGCIIGSIEVVKCIQIITIGGTPFLDDDAPFSSSRMFMVSPKSIDKTEKAFGDYREGRYAWILQNPRILKTPIPYKGNQGYYSKFTGDINQLEFVQK